MEDTVLLFFSANSFLSVFLTGGLSAIWGSINNLQTIAHMPLLNVSMPANAEISYKIILAIATFDLPFISDGTNFVKQQLVSLTSESEIIDNKTEKRRQLVTLSKST